MTDPRYTPSLPESRCSIPVLAAAYTALGAFSFAGTLLALWVLERRRQ